MDINKLMQQAQAMQKQMENASKEISDMEFEGEASNGLVKGDNIHRWKEWKRLVLTILNQIPTEMSIEKCQILSENFIKYHFLCAIKTE